MTAFERSARLACCALLVCAASLGRTRVLHAEPSDAQKETARSLMAEGRQLREDKDLHGALTRFQAANAIMGVPTTLLELAKAQADLGLLVEARSTLRSLLAAAAKDGEPEPFREARAKAEALDAELNARIGSLHFVVSGLPAGGGVTITVDSDQVPAAATAMPYRLDPGHHRIVANAEHAHAVKEVDVGEHDTLEVPLELKPDALPDAAPVEPAPRPAERTAVPALAYVGGGVGIAGLLVGGLSGGLALSKKHSAEAGCTANRCPPSTWRDLDSAHSLATVSTVGFIVAGAGLGIGIGSLLFSNRSPEPPVQAALVVSAGLGCLDISGKF